jgi:hypothetical protein
MRIPIRMIGLATTFFWVFLIAFFITAVYSAKDIHFDFGEPQVGVSSTNRILFSLPVMIVNNGLYDVGSFNVTTRVIDAGGSLFGRGSTFIPVISKNSAVNVTHNMTISANSLLRRDSSLLFNDSDLNLYVAVGLQAAEVIPIQASTNFSVPWGAPFYNFMLGTPAYSLFNATHFQVSVPVSFDNHAFFDVDGSIETRMYNSSGSLVGDGETTIYALQMSSFNGYVDFYAPISGTTPTGRFEIYFRTTMFNYGPWVIPYG